VPTEVFAVLADPTRRRVVEVLHAGELSVNDIVARVDVEQSGVSRHLRLLHEAGFVRVRADGQKRLYSLRPEPFEQLDAWLRRYAHDQVGRLERLAEFVDEKPRAKAGTKPRTEPRAKPRTRKVPP